MCRKKYLLRINHSYKGGLFYWWCAYKRILHKNPVLPFRQIKLDIFKR